MNRLPWSSVICVLWGLVLSAAAPQQPQQQRQRAARPKPKPLSVEEVQKRIPSGVTFLTDIAYREGNEKWRLDLAMLAERGAKPRPGLVFVHGGGWAGGDKRVGPWWRCSAWLVRTPVWKGTALIRNSRACCRRSAPRRRPRIS